MACLLPVALGLALLFSPLERFLATLDYDLLFLVRPRTSSAELAEAVVLIMDEDSRIALGQDAHRPWDRRLHARLVRELTARGARVIAFDVLFDEPAADPGADASLGAAIREHGRVVLAATVQPLKRPEVARPFHTLHPYGVIGSNTLWGVIEFPVGPGSIVRRHLNHLDLTNLAWQAALAFGKAPTPRVAPRWLNYYGPEGTIQTVSYHRALQTNALPGNFFAAKAVFVGGPGLITAQGQSIDRYSTPFTRWRGGQMRGVELQATAFLNLVRGDWLREFPPAAELLLVCAFGATFGLGLFGLRPSQAAVVAAVGALVVAGGAMILTWTSYHWFPAIVLWAIQIPCALAFAVLMQTFRLAREKEALQKDVALAESVACLPALLRDENAAIPRGPTSTLPLAEKAPPPIPNHRMLRRIGQGSYGEVWLARDDIGTFHAVKVVYARGFSSPAPYEREFRGIQKFTPLSRGHPGFVHILHVGRNDAEGYFFYIMELGDDEHCGQQIDPASYIPRTLDRQLKACVRLPVEQCVQLGVDLADALEHLHARKLVHRDIKPSNIIFVDGVPKFADVGLVTEFTPRGKDSTLVGTEGYLAPEGPGTPGADIYSLGKVLYEACTGRDRQQFPSVSGTLLATGGPDLSALNDVILRACHQDPKHRYQTAAELRSDLLALRQRLARNPPAAGNP